MEKHFSLVSKFNMAKRTAIISYLSFMMCKEFFMLYIKFLFDNRHTYNEEIYYILWAFPP